MEQEARTTRLDLKGAMLKYCIATIFSQAAFCPVLMAGTFLLGRGASSSLVGVMMALGNLLAVLTQPMISSTADSKGGLTLTQMLQGLALGSIGFSALAFFIKGDIASVVFLTGLFMLYKNVQPTLNTVSAYYQNRGASMNYGLARGMGSASYAAVSAVQGRLIASLGSDVIMLVGIFFMALYAASMILLPTPKDIPALNESDVPVAKDAAKQDVNYFEFLMQHRKLLLLILGLAMLFASMSPFSSYAILIVENAGGDAADMGNILALSALVEVPAMFSYQWLERRFGTSILMRIALVGFVLKSLAISFAPNVPFLYFAYALQFCGFALYMPCSVSYGNRFFGEGDKAKAIGLLGTASTIGAMVGSPIVGALTDLFGVASMLKMVTVISIIGCVIGLLGVEGEDKALTA